MADCSELGEPFLGLTDSVLRLPAIDVEAGETFYGRISFWFVYFDILGDVESLTLGLQQDDADDETREPLWQAGQSQSARWRFAQVTFTVNDNDGPQRLIFNAKHEICSPDDFVAIDSIVTERGTVKLFLNLNTGNIQNNRIIRNNILST